MFLPGESEGQKSLVGCRLWGRTESDTTEATKQQQQQQPFLSNSLKALVMGKVTNGFPSVTSVLQYLVFKMSTMYFLLLPALCLEKAMAPHSSTLAWKIPWMGEPGRLQSMGSLRVGHN